MIKDKNSLSEAAYKNYAFVEFFELEDAKKALEALGKGEVTLRNEVLSGNYSTKTAEDKNNVEQVFDIFTSKKDKMSFTDLINLYTSFTNRFLFS